MIKHKKNIGSILDKWFNSGKTVLVNADEIETLKFKKLHKKAIIPTYKTKQAAAFDFHALVLKKGNKVVIKAGEQETVRTGVAVCIPKGYEIQVRPRSGMARKNQISITNSPGTIDSDYLDEIGVILINHSKKSVTIKNRDRIAQGKLAFVPRIPIVEVDEFTEEDMQKDRGGGFGSTGK